MQRKWWISLLSLAAAWSAVGEELPCRWERLNLDGGGLIGMLAVDPQEPEVVFCASDKGGIHRSFDNGDTWQMCNQGLDRETFYGVSDILIDPANTDRVYAATGASWAMDHFLPGGVFRSVDRGENWERLTSEFFFAGEGAGKCFGNLLRFHPTQENTIYAASFNRGLWKSADGGESWTRVGLDGRFLTGVFFAPDDPEQLFVTVQRNPFNGEIDGGILASRDGGRTWESLLSAADVTSLAFHPQNPDRLLAAAKERLMYSEDRGRSWRVLPRHGKSEEVRKVAWGGANPERLWCVGGSRGIFYSDDLGSTWNWPTEEIAGTFHYPDGWFMSARQTDWTAMSGLMGFLADPTTPGRFFATDYFNVWRSDDEARNWQALPGGLNSLCVYQIVVDPRNPDTIYVNNADLGLLKSTDNGATFQWPFRAAENEDFVINESSQLWISPENPEFLVDTVTVDWRDPHWNYVCTSDNGGRNWRLNTEGLPFQRGGYITGLTGLDDAGERLLCAFSGNETMNGTVYLSRDVGKSWQPAGDGLPETQGLFGSNWKMLPNLARSGEEVYAVTYPGLFRANRHELKWSRIGDGVFSGELLTLAVSDDRPELVLVGTTAGIWASFDRGESWRKVSRPEMQEARGIAVDPFAPDRWYAAIAAPWWASDTNQPGIYVTDDKGANWARYAPLPANGLEWRISCDPHRPGVFYVGTNGAGAWRGIDPAVAQK